MFKITIVLILLCLSLISDIKTYKIKNKLVFTFMTMGIAINTMIGGLEGLKFSLLGLATPIFVLFILYVLRMLGAGDIKLFAAIGSIMGLQFVTSSMIYSFISGGAIGVIVILSRKNAFERFKYLWLYLKNIFLSKSIQPYTDFNDKEDKGKFRFAYAIFIGTIITIVKIYI